MDEDELLTKYLLNTYSTPDSGARCFISIILSNSHEKTLKQEFMKEKTEAQSSSVAKQNNNCSKTGI